MDVLEFLVEHNIPVMEWVPQSPDLNPIENLWSIVKHNVEKRMPKGQTELKKFMKEEWEKIPNSTLSNLVDSMKRRCELIIEKNGDNRKN